MPEASIFEFDPKTLEKVLKYLKTRNNKMLDAMEKTMDYAGAVIVAHARSTHFFVGVGKDSEKAAQEHVFTFKNPDGSPRFKIRTGN